MIVLLLKRVNGKFENDENPMFFAASFIANLTFYSKYSLGLYLVRA